jgi:hypothetical protein
MKLARQKQMTIPIGVCMSCFNEQQQLRFPFLVYCTHSQTLAVIRGPDEHAAFQCAPAQLDNVLKQLGGGAEALRI